MIIVFRSFLFKQESATPAYWPQISIIRSCDGAEATFGTLLTLGFVLRTNCLTDINGGKCSPDTGLPPAHPLLGAAGSGDHRSKVWLIHHVLTIARPGGSEQCLVLDSDNIRRRLFMVRRDRTKTPVWGTEYRIVNITLNRERCSVQF